MSQINILSQLHFFTFNLFKFVWDSIWRVNVKKVLFNMFSSKGKHLLLFNGQFCWRLVMKVSVMLHFSSGCRLLWSFFDQILMGLSSAFTLNLRIIKPNPSVKEQIIVRIGKHEKRKQNMKADFLNHDPNHYCRCFEIKIFFFYVVCMCLIATTSNVNFIFFFFLFLCCKT